MAYLIYVVVKFACYTAWSWLGLRILQPVTPTFWRATGFGVLRLGIGIVAGVSIFFLVTVHPEELLWKYIEIYTPVRMLEWLILALIMRRRPASPVSLHSLLWCLGGILVSYASDFASPEGLSGHFCVGRCLC
jgi:hypothetical protein